MMLPTDMRRLNANQLKLIAVLAMTADHIAWLLFPGYSREPMAILLHVIGRLTCPIMCYFIAEGYHYTHSVRRYAARLFAFAFLSHFAYIFASGDYVDARSFIPFYYGSVFNQTGVMWSLAWGLVLLCQGVLGACGLPCGFPGRLELHRLALRAVHRRKPRQSAKADRMVYVLRGDLRGGLCACARPALRSASAVCGAVRAADRAL